MDLRAPASKPAGRVEPKAPKGGAGTSASCRGSRAGTGPSSRSPEEGKSGTAPIAAGGTWSFREPAENGEENVRRSHRQDGATAPTTVSAASTTHRNPPGLGSKRHRRTRHGGSRQSKPLVLIGQRESMKVGGIRGRNVAWGAATGELRDGRL